MAEEVITQEGTDVSERSEVDAPREGRPGGTVVIEAEASLLKEYVAASDYTYYRPWVSDGYVRALPNPTDVLMRDFGSKLYEIDMPNDPQVYSTGSILVMAILAQGVMLTPPVPKTHPEYEGAKTILDFLDYNIRNLKRSFSEVLYELTDGTLKMGHKVGELIYELRKVTAEAGPQLVQVDIKTKPSEATAFVVDGFNNTLGLLYVQPGKPLPNLGNLIDSSTARTANVTGTQDDGSPKLIPRSKFIIPVHKPRNGDPRGTSHYRSVYTNFWKKQNWNPQHMAFVTRFAQPSVVGNLSKDAKDIPVTDGNNKIIGSKSIVQSTISALTKIKGGAAGAFIDTEVEMLESANEGKVIFDSFNHEDGQIAKGMLMQTLTTEQGKNMARAASAIHQDVFGILITFLRSMLEWSIKYDMLQKLVRYNFGEEAATNLTPNVSLGGVQVQDVPAFMASLAQLANAKGIHWSMWPAVRALLGLPPADEEEEAKDVERQREMQDAALEAVQNPPAQQTNQPPSPGNGPSPGGGRPRPRPSNDESDDDDE